MSGQTERKKSKIESVYVWLKPGKYHVANVLRDTGKYRSRRITNATYFRLERICKAYQEREGRLHIRNRDGATHYSLIINPIRNGVER